MSHIPNSAMPHAAPTQDGESGQARNEQGAQGSKSGSGSSMPDMSGVTDALSKGASKIADLARENPKTAIAAGVAVAAGAIAAAAIPALRGSGSEKKSASSGTAASKKKTTGKA